MINLYIDDPPYSREKLDIRSDYGTVIACQPEFPYES